MKKLTSSRSCRVYVQQWTQLNPWWYSIINCGLNFDEIVSQLCINKIVAFSCLIYRVAYCPISNWTDLCNKYRDTLVRDDFVELYVYQTKKVWSIDIESRNSWAILSEKQIFAKIVSTLWVITNHCFYFRLLSMSTVKCTLVLIQQIVFYCVKLWNICLDKTLARPQTHLTYK